jgi:hypothetical protein
MIKHNHIRVVTTGAAVVQVAGPNRFRIGVIVSVPDTNNPNLKFGEVAAAGDGLASRPARSCRGCCSSTSPTI